MESKEENKIKTESKETSETEKYSSTTTASGSITYEKIDKPALAKHDPSILDLAFVMDCTGSMGSYIQNATESIRKIVEEIVSMEKSDVKLALVEYRDHPPQDATFVVREHDFTDSIKQMKQWLEACKAEGGGDTPEAVADGLQAALKLNWREKSTKICVLISDAPPHGLGDFSDGFPNGCPEGIDPVEVVSKMAEKEITLYSIGCEPSLIPYKEFFTAISYKTGGQYIPLRNANLLSKVIVGGAVEEISLERLVEDAQREIHNQQVNFGITDEAELAQLLHEKLKSKGYHTNQIKLNNKSIEKASERSVKYSRAAKLCDLKKDFVPLESVDSPLGSYLKSKPAPAVTSCSFGSAPASTKRLDATASASYGHAFGAFGAPVSLEPLVDEFSIAKEEISYAQTERLVQKALNRKK